MTDPTSARQSTTTPAAEHLLVAPNERRLGSITLVLGLLVWVALIVGSFGLALLYVLLAGLVYLFAQSGFIAYLRGQGAQLSERQYPELYRQLQDCCKRLNLKTEPETFVLQGGGWMNAFAARFLGKHYVVLLSDVVDAMDEHPDGVRFYIGHELGHICRGHLIGQLWRLPVLWLPLLGAAYSRARESSCDLHGLACCSSRENGARALAALAVGPKRWPGLSLDGLAEQLPATRGFWMSFHELTQGYPWLTKRIARLERREIPGRHPLAWILALFTPYGGRSAGALGPLIGIAVIGVLAAIAIPAYQAYTHKARLAQALVEVQPVQEGLVAHYQRRGEIPATLEAVRLPSQLPGGATLELNPNNMMLKLRHGAVGMVLLPRKSENGAIVWACEADTDTKPAALPASCG